MASLHPDDDQNPSSPTQSSLTPTPYASRPPLHRTVSHGSQWSAADTPQHHNIGTSYSSQYPRPVSPSVRRHPGFGRSLSTSLPRRPPARSTSVGSSRAHGHSFRDDGGLLSEDDEDEDEDDIEHSVASSRGKAVAMDDRPDDDDDDDDADADDEARDAEQEDDPITLKERQSLINVEHPFGLPIWKPALYKKSRSVTRYADQALHSIPSAQAERHLLPGNILWTLCFGWWLAIVCFIVSAVLFILPQGGRRYASLVFGLGWYLGWPFGKYVEGHLSDDFHSPADEESPRSETETHMYAGSDGETIRAYSPPRNRDPAVTPQPSNLPPSIPEHAQSVSWNSDVIPAETTSLLQHSNSKPTVVPLDSHKSYGATVISSSSSETIHASNVGDAIGKAAFWLFLISLITPLMLLVCLICWGLVITIPMAKLNWALIKHLFQHPTSIRFCSAPSSVLLSPQPSTAEEAANISGHHEEHITINHPRLSAGQVAPSGSPDSTVLLCIYRAIGWQFYKYTVGGVNIMFINLLPLVFFVIFDGFVLLPIAEQHEKTGGHVPALLALLASRALIFLLSLLSVIPLSYFIGMAVASISAQSSIGMGAVINATFGSIIEILLYAIALTQGKGRLVEGSIVGSLLAGVLLMPGVSMCSGAIRRKEHKFNAKSAGVTSTMLIMAIIGTLTPTLFYQTYGNFELICDGCPDHLSSLDAPWTCKHCTYKHPDPVHDPFYQSTVKTLMYFCAAILLFSYLIGLWFSLRTHASQIWQNPQQLLHPQDPNRLSLYPKIPPQFSISSRRGDSALRHKSSLATTEGSILASRSQTPVPRLNEQLQPSDARPPPAVSQFSDTGHGPTAPSTSNRRISYAPAPVIQPTPGYAPILETVDHAIKDSGLRPSQLPENMTADDFTRAVAVATVSALRHHNHVPRVRSGVIADGIDGEEAGGGHGGHEGPSWSRLTSASVLLACTALYAIIAELLVDVVDVVLEGSGIDEKFLGVTLFALVPNTTEFMNAVSFALNGNIALSMEIGSAYALQVCLVQIPAMVAFSAWYDPVDVGKIANTFTLIFPRWDVIVIILSIFLLTYTYIEAKANYHRGSILILSYLVLTSGFFFAPNKMEHSVEDGLDFSSGVVKSFADTARLFFTSVFN
ncbi:hypothetical protein EW146_g836 [Bondarzewia mesenterica]|uniref:Sodium/calcium exchanger membrane region domain-containing protein n=1 Tax=Bondarzewia mesenterica TaxID=1095465 RepID=A0A4S4M5R8_9AGAM|nr:hypothetical protein EW146_g836 [Bondarzewia mesenterica]